MAGWSSQQAQTAAGAVESEQRVLLRRPVVEFDERGARRLGVAYWDEVRRSTFGLVRIEERGQRLDLRLFGRGPRLLSFAEPVVEASPASVRCSYAIQGGLLARRPAGEISFAQSSAEQLELCSALRDFFPRLATGRRRTGALYTFVQSRLHVAISRRYFARLIAEAGR